MSDLSAATVFPILSSRVLDYPPAKVFGAFADPEVLARWWGPAGFTDTISVFEFHVGGRWTHVLRGPDGQEYPNDATFAEIVAPLRIGFDHNSGKRFTIGFAPERGGAATRFSLQIDFESAEAREAARAVVESSNQQNIDRLVVVLAEL